MRTSLAPGLRPGLPIGLNCTWPVERGDSPGADGRGCPEFCVKVEDVNSLASLLQIGDTEGVTASEKTTRFSDAPRTAPIATQRVSVLGKLELTLRPKAP
jgi:hypothetical protein